MKTSAKVAIICFTAMALVLMFGVLLPYVVAKSGGEVVDFLMVVCIIGSGVFGAACIKEVMKAHEENEDE